MRLVTPGLFSFLKCLFPGMGWISLLVGGRDAFVLRPVWCFVGNNEWRRRWGGSTPQLRQHATPKVMRRSSLPVFRTAIDRIIKSMRGRPTYRV